MQRRRILIDMAEVTSSNLVGPTNFSSNVTLAMHSFGSTPLVDRAVRALRRSDSVKFCAMSGGISFP